MIRSGRLRRACLRIEQNFWARPRFFIAAAAGTIAAIAAPQNWGAAPRATVGRDVGTILFLILIFRMALRSTSASMRERAAGEDEARWVFLGLMALASFFSMFAILGVLGAAKSIKGPVSAELTVLAGATVLLSWLFIHTVFAVHYAHDFFYGVDRKRGPGLAFPGDDDEPDYWDFLYFSFASA